MTLTRRQTIIGAAATMAVAALPAVKAVESWSMEFEETDDRQWRLVSTQVVYNKSPKYIIKRTVNRFPGDWPAQEGV